jgi:hypothetical protein
MFKVGVFLFAHHITHCIVGTTTEYISAHLRRKGFPVIVSPWLAGQLYVVVDCPKTIAESLPLSLYLAVKNYTFISDEERAVVERFQSALPHPAWLRIRSGEYRGDMAQTFEQSPNGLIKVLIVARCFPYTMPRGS